MGGFRGDLSTLGLADIFQTLSNSQKEGTLVVGDGESRKCIYFGKEGLSLLSLGSRKGLRICDLLLKAGKISPDQLKDLLEQCCAVEVDRAGAVAAYHPVATTCDCDKATPCSAPRPARRSRSSSFALRSIPP